MNRKNSPSPSATNYMLARMALLANTAISMRADRILLEFHQSAPASVAMALMDKSWYRLNTQK